MDKETPQTRREQKAEQNEKVKLLDSNMKSALATLARTKEGILVLRHLLHESGFLRQLTYETTVGVNKDVLLAAEAKRCMYLGLRAYMDMSTVMLVEFDEIKGTNKEG